MFPKTSTPFRFSYIFRDPGMFLAIANAFLFLKSSLFAFITILLAIALIFALRFYGRTQCDSENALLTFLHVIGQKKFLGLEIMGYACLTIAFMAMIQQQFIYFICSFCFGLANLLLAFQLTPHLYTQAVNWGNVIKKVQSTYALTPILLATLNEPVLLICIGFIHAGLAAGAESLWILPIILVAPFVILTKPKLNRAYPQSCFCLGALWYTYVALSHQQWLLALSNALCAVAYAEIAIQEHRLFITRLQQRL